MQNLRTHLPTWRQKGVGRRGGAAGEPDGAGPCLIVHISPKPTEAVCFDFDVTKTVATTEGRWTTVSDGRLLRGPGQDRDGDLNEGAGDVPLLLHSLPSRCPPPPRERGEGQGSSVTAGSRCPYCWLKIKWCPPMFPKPVLGLTSG